MRDLSPAVIPTINSVVPGQAFVWLLRVQPNETETLYLCSDSVAVVYDGITWQPFPFEVGPIDEDSGGTLSGVQITVANVTREIGALVERNRGFVDAAVNLTLIHRSHADYTRPLATGAFRVQRSTVAEDVCSFTIGNDDLIKFESPAGRFFRGRCRWAYKSAECGYSGGLATCDRTLRSSNGCEAHANQERFGGFPGIPRR